MIVKTTMAKQLGATGAALLAKRQFVLFDPTTLEQLKNSDNLSQKLFLKNCNDAMSSKLQ
jgi:hypothetical protein